ncbi:MAG: hypothetical protein QHJ73_17955, partial [Armatimonadota bacterium]|nr:hypothetical protein [Armatimonadota bacterium]
MQADLKALVAYYLKCLAEERLGQPEARVAEAKGMLFPTPPPLPDSWEALLASEPALCAHRSASRKEGTAVLWAPVQWVKQGRDDLVLEPVCGIFCTVTPQKLIADPADVWVGDVLSSELAEQEYSELRNLLEQAAGRGPRALEEATLSRLREEGRPEPETSADWEQRSSLQPNSLLHIPACWHVKGESPYDRGLVEELGKLESCSPRETALNLLFHPPAAHDVPT